MRILPIDPEVAFDDKNWCFKSEIIRGNISQLYIGKKAEKKGSENGRNGV